MSKVAIGDLAQSMILRRHSAELKGNLQRLSTESVTGLIDDKTAHVSGDYGPMAGIESTLSQLSGYRSVNAETGIIAGIMQTTLGGIDTAASTLGASIMGSVSGRTPTQINAIGFDAAQKLTSAMAQLNGRVGERSLFAGVATNSAAVVPAETMMTALDGVIAGALSADDIETAVSAWFDDPLGYEATVYQGGADLPSVPIGPDETAQLDITARDPALRDTIKGLAMAALLDRGALAGNALGRADLAKRAGESLLSSQTARSQLAARLGATEANIATASVRNDTEKTALELARLNLISVDPYETASKLQATQSQLETLYAITARMSRLSLVNFL